MDSETIICDEARGVAVLVPFKAASGRPDWQSKVEKILRRALEHDGCLPETIEVDEPWQASNSVGLPLPAWEMRATGYRPHQEG